MRPTGASSSSKAVSIIAAAISAPTPHIENASSTTSKWPVLATLWAIVSTSKGTIVRRSITSQEIPSAASFSAASTQRWTGVPQLTIVRSVPGRTMLATPNGMKYSPLGTGPLLANSAFGSSINTGSLQR